MLPKPSARSLLEGGVNNRVLSRALARNWSQRQDGVLATLAGAMLHSPPVSSGKHWEF